MKTPFSISPRVIAHFGEDLIKNESIAILELVKNSYDACATLCQVNFEIDEGTLKSIVIKDDGHGMNHDIVMNAWLVIGTDYKQKKRYPNNCGRFPLGEKGIGRLGVHKLGNTITIISKSEKENEVHLKINWSSLNNATKIDDFSVDIEEVEIPTIFTNGTHGTSIKIEDLKTRWDNRRLKEVYRNLTSLNSPFSGRNDSFSVKIDSNTDVFSSLPSFQDIKDSGLYFGHCKMKGKMIYDFKYEFRPWSLLKKVDEGRVKLKKELLDEDLYIKGSGEAVLSNDLINKGKQYIDLDQYQIGDIEFDIIIYETDSQIFGLATSAKSIVKQYLKENGGIRVYRDDVRVYDYGERDNDWLGIDLKRVHRVGGNVSNNIILGSVKLKRSESMGLKEKTNREGFIENESYFALVDAVNHAMSLIVRERNIDKEKLSTLYKRNRVTEPVLADLNTVIRIVEDKVTSDQDRVEILKYLYRISEQYREVKEILIRSANAGLNLGVVIHEIEKQIASLIGFAKKGDREQIVKASLILERIVRGYTAMIKKTSIKETTLSSIISPTLDNCFFRFEDHEIDIILNGDVRLKAYLAKAEGISVLTNIIDNSIFWLSYARKKNRIISVYITDQIEGYSSIIVSDNGPGFKIPTEIAIKPFITGKPNNIGMGLGLHISDEMMRAMRGQLRFLEFEDIDFPEIIRQKEINKAIIAMCFPKTK